tara:strand:- start:44 stop:337 length:294 start_codon:yes stop_codon:yes gene_type:complete
MKNAKVTFQSTPTFTHHTDAGHGWVEVPKDLAFALGFTDEISSYSFHNRDNYYLEEDSDAGLLINALKNRGQEFNMDNLNTDEGDSFIRSLSSVRSR